MNTNEVLKLALEALEFIPKSGSMLGTQAETKRLQAITVLREALAEQPAQRNPLTDIYRSFEQWKCGNVLEHGVPRTEFYTKADLDLVEMGWRYGYDAGRAVEQALNKMAENARELGLDYEPAQQEPVAMWDGKYQIEFGNLSAYKHGEHSWIPLYTSPPAQQEPVTWGVDWGKAGDIPCVSIIKRLPGGGIEVVAVEYAPYEYNPPAQRTWVGLTPEEKKNIFLKWYGKHWAYTKQVQAVMDSVEAKLKEKNL